MNKLKLIQQLRDSTEEDVYIDIDGTLYEIEINHEDEVFDGFDTLYPASLTLKPV